MDELVSWLPKPILVLLEGGAAWGWRCLGMTLLEGGTAWGWCCSGVLLVVYVDRQSTAYLWSLLDTFCLDESLPTATLLPLVPQSTRPLRRNYTTLTKYNLLSSIIIRHPHRQIGHGNINKIIWQLLGDLLTPRLQRLPTKSRLRCTSSSCRPLISSQTTKKIAPAPQFSGVQNYNNKNNNKIGHTKWNPLHTSQKPLNPNG